MPAKAIPKAVASVSCIVARIGLPAERMTDDALLAGLAAGGPEVGLAFVRRFQRHVFGVALAVVGDRNLAEDVAQQTFERAWKRAAIGDLPAEQARAIVMAGVYGMTAQEIAEADGIPLGTAKTRIRSAMIKLRVALDARERTHD